MKKESIYRFISRMSAENPGLPYSFQDVNVAGRRDISYVIWDDSMSFHLQEKLSKELVEQLIASLTEQTPTKELRQMLREKPIFLYLTKIVRRIRLCLSEKLVNEKQLYTFGIKLATLSESEEETKLGMLILGFFENDVVRKILRTLGLHSSLTLYALEASKNFMNQNQFTFDLAKNTCGYGKFAALYLLDPILQEQKKWIFEFGAINEVLPNMSAIMCLEKADMGAFYKDLELTEVTFSKLSYLLAYAGEANNIKDFSHSLMLVERYIDSAKTYGKSFVDLAAIVMIKKSMASYWEQSKVDLEKKNGWTRDKENVARNICNLILELPKWKEIMLKQLNQPYHKTSLIISVLKEIDLLPVFIDLLSMLQRDFFDMDILDYVLIENPKEYVEDVFYYLNKVLPEEVLCESPQEILEDDITSEYKPDIWLVYLLKAMRKEKYIEEEFYIRCLTCRFPDVRIEAIQALRSFKLSWSENVLLALERAYKLEPVKNIKKRLLRLMGRNDNEKERKYIDVSNIMITPSSLDICLFNTKIAGTFFKDLSIVEGQIEAGDILYLVREPDNKYDDKAIIVTTEDGYSLGYVPRTDNSAPASMLDAGEKLYAILYDSDLELGKIDIKIMLSRKPKKNNKIVPFPL